MAARLLAALYRVTDRRHLPEVATVEARRHLLTRRVTHWVALAADDLVWQQVPASLLPRLDLCTTRSQIRQLLDSAPLPVRTRVERTESRPGVPGVAPTPATGPARQASPPMLAGRARMLRGVR